MVLVPRIARSLADWVSLEPALLGETLACDGWTQTTPSESSRTMLPVLRETGTCRVSARCQSRIAEEVWL